MKIIPKLIIFLFFISCEIETISIEDKPIAKPIFTKAKRANFSEKNGNIIIEEKIGKDSNFFYENSSSTYFLLSYYPTFYDEKLTTFSWSDDGNYVVFFINNSNRYKSKNRLVLFKLNSLIPKVLIDEKTAKIKSAEFEQSKFIYQLDDGTEISVSLI